MQEILINLTPVFGFFLLGLLLRRISLISKENAIFLLGLITFVTLPALILVTVSQSQLTRQTALLPVTNVLVDIGCMIAMLMFFYFNRIEKQTRGAMLISVMVTNNVFMFPFIMAVYGHEGFVDAAMFDFGNALFTNTVTYALAMYYGGRHSSFYALIGKLFKTTLFWAVALALVLNLTSTQLPTVAVKFLTPLGQMTGPLTLIVLGVLFAPRLQDIKDMVPTLVIRMGLGFVMGFGIATMFGFTGTTFAVVALCSGAPIGFIVLSFSALNHLNTQFTATAVSMSVLLGMLIIPTLMYFLGVPL